MDKPTNIYQKIFNAKKFIASQSTKKAGRNKFSGYDYYTPEQIESLVISACEKNGIDFHFSLLQDEIGLYGKTVLVNLDNPQEQVSYELRTEVPEIKATNRTQQYGGAMTYCRRYMLQNIFSIVDNELDFDNEHSVHKNNEPTNGYITEPQRKRLFAIVSQKGIPTDQVKGLLSQYGIPSSNEIPKAKYDEIVAKLENLLKQ